MLYLLYETSSDSLIHFRLNLGCKVRVYAPRAYFTRLRSGSIIRQYMATVVGSRPDISEYVHTNTSLFCLGLKIFSSFFDGHVPVDEFRAWFLILTEVDS